MDVDGLIREGWLSACRNPALKAAGGTWDQAKLAWVLRNKPRLLANARREQHLFDSRRAAARSIHHGEGVLACAFYYHDRGLFSIPGIDPTKTYSMRELARMAMAACGDPDTDPVSARLVA